MERDIKTKISRSNVRLMVDKQKKGWGFYASILFKMPMIAKDDVQTMATDGKSIFYNPEWSNTLTDESLVDSSINTLSVGKDGITIVGTNVVDMIPN